MDNMAFKVTFGFNTINLFALRKAKIIFMGNFLSAIGSSRTYHVLRTSG